MSRLTEYWETYNLNHDDFLKEGMNLDDLLLKTKFNFHQGNLTFKSKSKYNFDSKGARAAHDLSLKYKCSKGSTIELKEKDNGENTLEAVLDLGNKDDFSFTGFANVRFLRNANVRDVESKIHLRTHYKNQGLLSLGVEGWDPLSGAPRLVSAGTSYGHKTDDVHSVFNTYFVFNTQERFLSLAKFFVQASRQNFQGRLVTNVNRSLSSTEGNDSKSVSQNVDVNLSFSHQYDSKTRVGGELNYDYTNKSAGANLAISHQFDRLRFNGKISTDRSLTCGLTSVHDDFTFTVSGRGTLNSSSSQVEDKEVRNYWVAYKFGISLECNRL